MSNKTLKQRSTTTAVLSDKKCCEATFIGLHKWYVKEFEHLGWMILAKDKGLTGKINNYKESVQRLKTSIEMKMEKVQEQDRKDDLQILLKNVNVLIDHIEKDF